MIRAARRARRRAPPRRTPSPSATAPAPRTTRATYIQPSAASTRMIDVSLLAEVLDRDREDREVGQDEEQVGEPR